MPQNPNEPDSLDHDLTQAYSSDERASQTDSLDDGNTAGGIGASSSDISRFDEGWEQATESKGLETRYEVAEAIGHGGMGEVYKGTDTRLKRPVAIKRLKGDLSNNKRAVERFSTEAEAVARLNHYNIVQIYDVGHDAQGHYIVMELVDGDSLATRLKQSGAIQLEAAIEIKRQELTEREVMGPSWDNGRRRIARRISRPSSICSRKPESERFDLIHGVPPLNQLPPTPLS
jgi:serine/threonine protein kinase